MSDKQDLLNSYRKENQLRGDKIKILTGRIKKLEKIIEANEELIEYQEKLATYWEMKYNKKNSWLYSYHEPPFPKNPKINIIL